MVGVGSPLPCGWAGVGGRSRADGQGVEEILKFHFVQNMTRPLMTSEPENGKAMERESLLENTVHRIRIAGGPKESISEDTPQIERYPWFKVLNRSSWLVSARHAGFAAV